MIKQVQSNNLSSSNDNSRMLFKKNLTRFLEKQKQKKILLPKEEDKKECKIDLPPKHQDTFNGESGVSTWTKMLQAGFLSND